MKNALCVVILGTAALAGAAFAGQDKEEKPLRLEINLVDGSRVMGGPAIESIPMETSYARMNVPLKNISAIRIDEDHKTASIDLKNTDRMKGVVDLGSIGLETIFGKVAVNIGHIREIRVVAGGGILPAGEGALSFGGVKWTLWRTMFEVQGDRLVSLPRVREGFNYGHGGNGRGATLMTNVGSKEWKDYSVEFEFGMSGVNPSFNRYSLPLDYRSGTISFHVADVKESWNERGGSMYSLGFGGDGSWNLTCSYNFHCAVPNGFGNPTSDGSRSLAEGKGLKHDRKTGNKIRIDVSGKRIQIWVDGEKIADVRDEKMGEPIGGQTIDHGGIGIGWGFESMGWIRNFSARRL